MLRPRDRSGQAGALTVLTRVIRGREEPLRATLAGLPGGERSPLAQLDGTHFGRWVLVGDLAGSGGGTESAYLVFATAFDGAPEHHVEQLRERIPDTADDVWRNCDHYPGTANADRFRAWIGRHRVASSLFVSAYPQATLGDVRAALDVTRRLLDFAPRAGALDDERLRTEFAREFAA